MSRSVARIDLDALMHNVGVVAELARGAEVMAVVKADAYGHGMVRCAQAVVAAGAQWLGVAFLEEALALRAAGLTAPVLAWLFAPTEDLAPAMAAGIDLAVYDLDELERVVAGAPRGGARIHLKADTGLSRGGAPASSWPALCRAVARAESAGRVRVVGVWSHLACSELGPDHPANVLQRKAFTEALDVAAEAGLRPQLRHLANSGALLTDPETHYDLVRPGAALYGLEPVRGLDVGLRPVMSLHSTVALVKRVPAGSGVSYGHTYTTDRETTLALVPLGYADGIPWVAGNAGPVQLGGSRRTVAGRMAMDQFVVDVGDDPVVAGDPVLMFGPDGPRAGDWAQASGSIDYEIVTRIGARVPREYLGGPR